MAAALVDDVVSPELALVDPELAARVRPVLPNAGVVERSFAIGFEFVPEELLPDDAVTNRRRNVLPLFIVAGVLVASIVGAGVLRASSSPTTNGSRSASGTAAPMAASAQAGSPASEAASPEGAVTTAAAILVARVAGSAAEPEPRALDASSVTRTPSLSTGDAVAPVVAPRSTSLVWDALGDASSYDIELVRDGSRIFSASSRSPQVNVPRSWMHDGERFAVQPEDVVYIWPVVDGRRGSRPLVNGTQVFDNTLVARFTG